MRQTLLLIILLITCPACLELTYAQTTLPAPEGWVLVPKPKEAELRCANYSKREWKVRLEGERLQISLDEEQLKQAPLPRQIRSRNVQVGSKGDRYILRVKDGWIVGIDIGEFGGGLWWFSADGKRSKRLSRENVHGLVQSQTGVLVLTGLSHGRSNYGDISRITGTGENSKLALLADIGGAPRTFIVESPTSLLVATDYDLVRVRTSGQVETLIDTDYGLLYPGSMTLSPDGIIHFGMRHFVTRLTPKGKTYTEEWFLPQDCTNYVRRDYDCVCSKN